MARLYRPSIPVEVRLRVVLRQRGEMFPDDVVAAAKANRAMGRQLKLQLEWFAGTLGCEVKDLRLDHEPALALRPQRRHGLGRKTYYVPDANDPEHLFYRPHGAQFAGSHDVKTRIRGDHGQLSDVALIKRERRRQKRASQQKRAKPEKSKLPTPKRGRKIGSPGFYSRGWPKRSFPKKRKP